MATLPLPETQPVTGQFGRFRLSSAFQPILSISHRRPVGFEGLLRATDAGGRPLPPSQVFGSASATADTVRLDRACRSIHVANYAQQRDSNAWLFLNINPRVVVEGAAYGPFFSELLASHRLSPRQVVVEILESEIQDEYLLAETVDYYRRLGCLVAVDDFGTGHSNFDRIVRLQPDIVKLDRSIIRHAVENATARRILPNLVALLHEAGCLVVMEGIEDAQGTLLAMDANADLVQGFYFCRPKPMDEVMGEDYAGLFDRLDRDFCEGEQCRNQARDGALLPHRMVFLQCAAALTAGEEPAAACRRMLTREGVLRCYLLDPLGTQIGPNLAGHHTAPERDQRFDPLAEIEGANWSRKPYFRNAIASPGRVQVTRPYLSITGGDLCVTLSVTVNTGEGMRVMCCDIKWEGGV